jgi:hypothetical protein
MRPIVFCALLNAHDTVITVRSIIPIRIVRDHVIFYC